MFFFNSFKNKILLLCFLSFFVSCEQKIIDVSDTLRVTLSSEPDTLNFLTASDAYASRIHEYVHDNLIKRNPDTLEYEPALAKSWTISDDKLVYTFYLRDDATWHDGKPFTADDIVYSFQKIQDPTVEAPFLRVYYADIDRVEKIDATTVQFIYKKKYFMGLSVCGGIPIVPKHIYDTGLDFNANAANRSPIGLGPYRFIRWKTNKQMVLERYENYWGEKPEIRKINFEIISEDAVALQVLKKGEIDMAGLRPIQWVKQTGSKKFNELFTKHKYLTPGYTYIGWNNKSPLFSDARVRLAMTHLVDRKKLLEKINYNLGVVVESPFFPESRQYNKDLPYIPYDPQKARALLKEAGWSDTDNDGWLDKDGKIFQFNFLYPAASKFTERMAPILKEDLKTVGIDMSIERIEWSAFLNKIDKREFEATALGWSSGFESDPYQLWHSSQAKVERGSNFIGFENAEVDSLLEAAREEFDEEKRDALYYRFQKIIYDAQPYTFLFSSYSLVAVANRFDNVIAHKAGLDTLEWKVKKADQE